MILLIGLGNPGDRYTFTRHNLGFLVIDEIARQLELSWTHKAQLQSDVAEGRFGEKKIILAKPQTYMNLSGESALRVRDAFHLESGAIHAIYDDVAVAFGSLRVRLEGSAGGHNGVKSLIEYLGDAFVRFRCGIGSAPESLPLDAYVLQRFSEDEQLALTKLVPQLASAILDSLRTTPSEVTHNFLSS